MPKRKLDPDELHDLIATEIEKVNQFNAQLDQAIKRDDARAAREWQLSAMRAAESISKYVHSIAKAEGGPSELPDVVNIVASLKKLEAMGAIAKGSINPVLLDPPKHVKSTSEVSSNGD